MIALSALGDIVEQSRETQQFRLRELRPDIHTHRMIHPLGFQPESIDFSQHPQCVFIHGIGMEQIELHLSDNIAPQRHIGTQHAVTVHRNKRSTHTARMAQDRDKQLSGLRILHQRTAEVPPGMAQLTERAGMNTGDGVIAGHAVKHPHNGRGILTEQRITDKPDTVAVQLKILIKWFWGIVVPGVQNSFVEQLQQHLIEFGHAAGDAVIGFHHPLDRLIVFAVISELLRHTELAVKQQAVVVAAE